MLRIERQKYDELRADLAASPSARPDHTTMHLRDSIARLQNSRSARVAAEFPEFHRLRASNEELRLKTLRQLRGEGGAEGELREHLRREEEGRGEFMEQLRRFKAAYERLKAENQELRERLARRQQSEAKENSNVHPRSKAASNRSLEVESQIKRRAGGSAADRLREYEAHVRMMQHLNG